MKLPRTLAPALAAVGLVCGAFSVLDPTRPTGALVGTLLVFAALAMRRTPRYRFAAVLAAAYSLGAPNLIEFRGDSSSYFAYLHSVGFDFDLDFRNELQEIHGTIPVPGRTFSVFSAGPAAIWSPFYLAAHLYVHLDHLLGRGLYPPDGFSLPYRRSTLLGTVTLVVLGGTLLALSIARRRGFPIAILSVAGALFASPVLYYTFFVPAMSHGVAFGLAAALLWAWDRTRERPSARTWTILGALLGLLAACRWQASVYGILVLLLALEGLARKTVRASWLAGAAAAFSIAFAPQLLAWKAGFGEWLVFTHGRGFFDLSSPHLFESLISADHGFFNWTPLMLVGFLGLILGSRESPMLHLGGLAVFFLTAWINGSVPSYDWAAGDAFGGRRYSEVVPLMAIGLASAISLSSRVLVRAPVLAPAAAIALLVLWNLGFVSHFRARKYPHAAPLERLARDQARALHRSTRDALDAAAGAGGRAVAYDLFSAEYFYRGLNPSGTILLRSAEERYLLRGWHTGSRRTAKRTYRRALHPEACVAIPLEAPFPLRIEVSARAPDGLEHQTMALYANGDRIDEATLGTEWQSSAFSAPEEHLVRGENELCLRFTAWLEEKDGAPVARSPRRGKASRPS